MAPLPGVTCPAVAPPHRALFALLVASVLSTPALAAQTQPPAEATEASAQEPGTGQAPTTASLERIRRALALDRDRDSRGARAVDLRDEVLLPDRRPPMELLPGLDFVGGVDLFDGAGTAGPSPLGPPTHRDMMSLAVPREFREAGSTDVLGIATASAFAVVPYVLTKIAGWFRGDAYTAPEHPILTEGEEALVLAGAVAGGTVLHAGIDQQGRTVTLSLVVPADTSPDTARALGKRFVLLVKTLASDEPDPEDEVGAGDFDYIVRVSSPADTVITLGGKATSDTKINW